LTLDLLLYFEFFDIFGVQIIDGFLGKYKKKIDANNNTIKITDNNKSPPETQVFDISDKSAKNHMG
jgi:hypothetical protein